MKIDIKECPWVLTHYETGQIGALLTQLSPSRTFQSREGLYQALHRNFMFLARDLDVITDELDSDSSKIVGMATLVLTSRLSGLVAQVEDVCVDKNYRGLGIARLLMQELMSLARERKVEYIDLTSNPNRKAARALYESLGFKVRKTTTYR